MIDDLIMLKQERQSRLMLNDLRLQIRHRTPYDICNDVTVILSTSALNPQLRQFCTDAYDFLYDPDPIFKGHPNPLSDFQYLIWIRWCEACVLSQPLYKEDFCNIHPTVQT